MPRITYANKTSGISEATADDYNEIKSVVNNIAYNFFNVKSYSATGDGVTDDTAAIQAAIDACIANGGGIVFFPVGVYLISGALQATYNSQLKITPLSFSTSAYSSITFLGEAAPTRQGLGAASSSTGLAQTRKGVIIISSLTTSSGNTPSVFGTVKHSSSNFNNNTIFVKNIRLLTTPNASNNTHMTGFNFGIATAASFENVVVGSTIGTSDLAGWEDGTVGIKMPYVGSNTNMSIRNCLVAGYKHGYVLGEHIVLDNADAFGCEYGFTQLPNTHANIAVRILPQWCVNGLNSVITDLYTGDMPANSETVGRIVVQCLNMEIEEGVVFNQTDYFINDPGNILCGSAGLAGYSQSDGADWPDSYQKNGGANFRTYRLHPDNGATDWTVTGSRASGEAQANLLTVLQRRGIIIDSTTA